MIKCFSRFMDMFPDIRYLRLAAHRFHMLITDDYTFIRRRHKQRVGREVNLENPETFNEKVLHRMLRDRKGIYTKLADKYLVREYIRDKVGEQYLVDLYGVYSSPADIDYERLPPQFVLKCNHDSGSVIICRDIMDFDKKAAHKKLRFLLRRNFYHVTREFHYRDIKPLILCEELLTEEGGGVPEDYKVFVFNQGGRFTILIQLEEDRFGDHRRGFYTEDWVQLPFRRKLPLPRWNRRPKNLEKMIFLAKKLGEDFDFVRVDFYEVDSRLYVGELTFTPGSGCKKFEPDEWDYRLGSYWMLNP